VKLRRNPETQHCHICEVVKTTESNHDDGSSEEDGGASVSGTSYEVTNAIQHMVSFFLTRCNTVPLDRETGYGFTPSTAAFSRLCLAYAVTYLTVSCSVEAMCQAENIRSTKFTTYLSGA
jgi:hypothetical protein